MEQNKNVIHLDKTAYEPTFVGEEFKKILKRIEEKQKAGIPLSTECPDFEKNFNTNTKEIMP